METEPCLESVCSSPPLRSSTCSIGLHSLRLRPSRSLVYFSFEAAPFLHLSSSPVHPSSRVFRTSTQSFHRPRSLLKLLLQATASSCTINLLNCSATPVRQPSLCWCPPPLLPSPFKSHPATAVEHLDLPPSLSQLRPEGRAPAYWELWFVCVLVCACVLSGAAAAQIKAAAFCCSSGIPSVTPQPFPSRGPSAPPARGSFPSLHLIFYQKHTL